MLSFKILKSLDVMQVTNNWKCKVLENIIFIRYKVVNWHVQETYGWFGSFVLENMYIITHDLYVNLLSGYSIEKTFLKMYFGLKLTKTTKVCYNKSYLPLKR